MPREHTTSDPYYRANRKLVLEDNPPCSIRLDCCTFIATTADHIVPVSEGGSDDLENLRPACRPCNSSLGASTGNRQRSKAYRIINEPVDKSPKISTELSTGTNDDAKPKIARDQHFHFSDEKTEAPARKVVHRFGELAPTSTDLSTGLPTGREQPRLETILPDNFAKRSLGGDVAVWAKQNMGVDLHPWQCRALDGMFCLNDDGELLFRESLISCARQQGKSLLMTAVLGFFVTTFARRRSTPQYALSVANRLDRAESIFTVLAPILVANFGGKQMQAMGRKSVTMPDGSRWEIRAATLNLVGGSYDLIVADELWNISQQCVDDCLKPSQIARANPHMAMFSTAGDESSLAMIQTRETCLRELDAGTTGACYLAEWSMPPGCHGQEYWGYANPSLGLTVQLDALKLASTKDSFNRQHLNLWSSAKGSWIDAADWQKLATDTDMPDGGILACDASADQNRFVGVRAVVANDVVQLKVEFIVDSMTEMWQEIERVMTDQTVQLLIGPTYEIHVPKPLARRCTTGGQKELVKYTGLVKAMIAESKVRHRGERTLAEHVCRAVQIRTSDGVMISSHRSPGPIELARCAVLAIAKASRPRVVGKPMLVVSAT